jgi:uncharacterized phiE125 gp8 family phage protein
MTLRLVTPAAGLPITLVEAKAQCRSEGSEENGLIESYIKAATAWVQRHTGRPILTQTWEEVLDAFPDAGVDIEIDFGPVSSVASIKYMSGGALETMSSEDYDVDTVSTVARIAAPDGWPAADDTMNAVVVQFVCGADEADEDVKQALKLIVGHWYANRESVVIGMTAAEVPMAAHMLLGLHRRMFV